MWKGVKALTASYDTFIDGRVLKTAVATECGYLLSYILAETRSADESGTEHRTFSVFAALCGEDGETDQALVDGMTFTEAEAIEFFMLVAEGAVMPCTLRDVAEDCAAFE